MICPKCKGAGCYRNPKYPNPASWSYAGEPNLPCRKCRQTGYIIGNVKDVMDHLKHLLVKFEMEGDKEYQRYTHECIKAIEGYEKTLELTLNQKDNHDQRPEG